MIEAAAPRDELEGALAVQMASTQHVGPLARGDDQEQPTAGDQFTAQVCCDILVSP
jgi:hypothetical protein